MQKSSLPRQYLLQSYWYQIRQFPLYFYLRRQHNRFIDLCNEQNMKIYSSFFMLYQIGAFMLHISPTLKPISRKLSSQQTVNDSRSYTAV